MEHALAARLLLTAAAACTAETATYPLDVLKTRLQLQGEGSAAKAGQQRLGALGMAANILRKEGLRGLYGGLTPAAVRHCFYSSTRITVYEQLRAAFASSPAQSSTGQSSTGQGSTGLAVKLGTGLAAGGIGQLVAVPADLIKVRMQADGRLVAEGKLAAPRYTGMLDALRKVVAAEGIAGLWRGSLPAVQRAALVNLGELTTYDVAKRRILELGVVQDGPAAHAMSSGCSGFVAALVSTPADVLKTRIMAQGQDPAQRRYSGMLDCLSKTVRAEGPMALYKGFWPTWARLAPWQLVFWVSYEELRVLGGLGTF